MQVIIPMAGLGSRFSKQGFKVHKPLIQVNEKTLVKISIESLDINTAKFFLIVRDLGNSYLKDLKSEIDSLNIDYKLIVIDRVTSGATETTLMAKKFLDMESELIVTNCDQYLEWDSEKFINKSREFDSSVLLYDSTDEKNSFVEIVNDKVVRVVEKQAISNHALVGVHYWKKARYCVDSGEELLLKSDINRETYLSETFNFLLKKGKTVGGINLEGGCYYSTGSPEDLALFKGYISEYKLSKNNTYFFDIDGTILLHTHRYSKISSNPTVCPGVVVALDEIDSRGDTIILCSSRKESARRVTEKILGDLMIPYNQLILGISQGNRFIVNDIKNKKHKKRAYAVNVVTDKGFVVDDLDGVID